MHTKFDCVFSIIFSLVCNKNTSISIREFNAITWWRRNQCKIDDHLHYLFVLAMKHVLEQNTFRFRSGSNIIVHCLQARFTSRLTAGLQLIEHDFGRCGLA